MGQSQNYGEIPEPEIVSNKKSWELATASIYYFHAQHLETTNKPKFYFFLGDLRNAENLVYVICYSSPDRQKHLNFSTNKYEALFIPLTENFHEAKVELSQTYSFSNKTLQDLIIIFENWDYSLSTDLSSKDFVKYLLNKLKEN